MKNLLVLSFFPAFIPPLSGGEARLYNFYFELSKFFNITLLSSGQLNVEPETLWHTNNFVEKRVPKDAIFAEHWKRLTKRSGKGDCSGPGIAACGRTLTELHKAYIEAYPTSDVIIHESPFTIDYDLFNGLDNKPRVYNSYNCEFELYKKLHASSASNEITKIVHDCEVKLLKSVDLLTYCSDKDLLEFKRMCPTELPNTAFIPNGMTCVAVSKIKSIDRIKRAVFIGSGHLPNVEAAEYIVKVLAPACPEITFDLIGNCLPTGKYPKNVICHGVVSTKLKSELITAAQIAINPMLSGGGSSLKVLDFVAHGIPIISTSIGMRGFEFKEGTDFLLAEVKDFPLVLKSLHNNTMPLSEMSVAARSVAVKNYSWLAVTNKFRELINNLQLQQIREIVTRPYVLALNDYDPFETVGGGATRLQGIYSAIAEWSHIVVICFSKDSTIEVVKISAGISCIRIPKTIEHIEEESFFNSQSHISANDIVAFRQVGNNPILNSVYDTLRKEARIVICDHPYMVSLPNRFGDRFVYSSQNFEYGLKESLFEFHPNKQELLDDVRRAEHLCVATSATIVAVSSEDANSFTLGKNAVAPIIVIPNGAAIPELPTKEDLSAVKSKIGVRSAVFLGSAHMPNIDSVNFIVGSLAIECKDVEFHIIGSVCQTLPKKLPANVFVWGELSGKMKSAVLLRCGIAINPMFSGSGSNIKLADFLANGLHVISTKYGVRGYPAHINPHVTISERESFAKTLRNMLNVPNLNHETFRSDRRSLFAEHLSMQSLGNQFVDLLKDLEKQKKRMLFVTYRYISPTRGGAEAMLTKLISEVGNSGKFSVDVISTEVCSISENGRFSSRYHVDKDVGAPIEMKNVRFARFPVDEHDDQKINEKLALAWRAQAEFEKKLYESNKEHFSCSGLAWGWGSLEEISGTKNRWGFSNCGLHLSERTVIRIKGYVPRAAILRIFDSTGAELLHMQLENNVDISFEANAGAVELYVAMKSDPSIKDQRPFGIYVQHLYFNNKELNLEFPAMFKSTSKDVLEISLQMEQASHGSRGRQSVNLTDIRGPHSSDLEFFLEEFVKDYDIVVTHNNIFRPAVAAISMAKSASVPTVLIPHAHLDDDFYHFPDAYQSALDADCVLAAPKAACQFYEHIGVKKVAYLPAGIDISEKFTDQDEDAFKLVYKRKLPFFLVLGRKAAAKGYLDIIKEIEILALTRNIHLVMIGPDDDGYIVNSKNVSYLGPQPRNIVRGALRSCIGLINMSSSESFGIVLLEAWLAGRPVIANDSCSAFHDLAVNEENALLVTKATLANAIDRLAFDNALCDRLAKAGKAMLNKYDWENICKDFMTHCMELTHDKLR
jgi:glycosyltransferase involved in cell wall biosynthesis